MAETDPESLPPAQSRFIRTLLDEVATSAKDGESCDVAIVREILWLITAHPALLAFGTAVQRLIEILDHFPIDWSDAMNEAKIDRWRPTLAWLTQNEQRLGGLIGEHYSRRRNTTGNNPMRGSGSAIFAFHAVLCEPLPPGGNGERFLLLSGHLLIAYVIAAREHSILEDYEMHGPGLDWNLLPNSAENACRAVRRLTEDRGVGLLAQLPVTLPPEEFAKRLEEIEPPEDPDLHRDHEHLYRFLQKAWNLLDWRESKGGGEGIGGGHRWVGGRYQGRRLTIEPYPLAHDDDPQSGWGTIDTVAFDAVSTRKKNLQLASDLSPEEVEADEEILLSDFDCESTRKDPGSFARVAQAKARYVARANQLFPWAYSRLTYAEAKELIQALRREIDELLARPLRTQRDDVTARCLFALAAMLVTGSSIERVAGMRLIEREDGNEFELGLHISSGRPIREFAWQIRVLTPEGHSDWSSDTGSFRGSAEHLRYPDHFGLAALLERLIPPGVRTLHGRLLYAMDIDELAIAIRGWLKKHYPDGRITPEKISYFLWSRIHVLTGDAALASSVTGTPHPLARVRLHYTSPRVGQLGRLYDEAFASLFPTAKAGKRNDASALAAGARCCPTIEAVRRMVDELRRDIEASRDYADRAGFARHHNLMTLYTVQFFAYATACRAIVTPYVHLARVDRQRGLTSLSDKDDESCHKTRLVWLPPVLIEQMWRYETHLGVLKAQLCDLPTALRDEPCLFIDGTDFTPKLVRPKTLEPQLMRYLDVRANTHRRFMRTELIERNCPPEVVDAYMGHWNAGEEPFHVFSSFGFDAYVAELSGFLLQILQDIGFDRALDGSLTCR